MCCRRNRRPLVVTAGILAYNEYQKHQQKKRDLALSTHHTQADASLPAVDPTKAINNIPTDSPPDYNSIDSPIYSKEAYEPDSKGLEASARSIASSPSTSSRPTLPTLQHPTTTPAVSYRVQIKTCHSALRSARLYTSDSCCAAYTIRHTTRPTSALTVKRSCASVATAKLLSPSTADVALDTLGLARTTWNAVDCAWDVVLPGVGGGMVRFRWQQGEAGVGGSAVWRLEDGMGQAVAVWMDDVGSKWKGKRREGVLNLIISGLSERMRDAVVASCFVVVKQMEGMVVRV